MTIKVRFFASLREQVGCSEKEVPAQSEITVNEVWNLSVQQHTLPTNTLVAINQEYASFDHYVQDGDEVAFFPPVTGG